MTTLMRWDPFRELEEMSTRLGTMLGRNFGRTGIESFGDWSPAVDVQETGTEYLVKADLPEMTKEQKAAEEKVSKLFAQNCSGIRIPIMKLPALMKLGLDALAVGKTDKEVGDLLYEKAVAFGKDG